MGGVVAGSIPTPPAIFQKKNSLFVLSKIALFIEKTLLFPNRFSFHLPTWINRF